MIRNFVYLDSDKLRSISSQIFEGVTEQVISTSSNKTSNNEEQKGPVASGRLLANIFSQEGSSSELKFMEDFAYTIFEKKLLDDGLVSTNLNTEFDSSKSFVKITANLTLNDLAVSSRTLNNFNDLGEAMWRVSNEQMIVSNNNGKIATDSEARKKAADNGMQLNKKVSDSALKLIDYGFEGMIEANMSSEGLLFSAPLKREFFRETERMIVHKYSRVSKIKFNMFGIITQRGGDPSEETEIPGVADQSDIRNAMRALSLHMRVLENVFNAPAHNEIIIDPIAIYSII